MRLNHVFNILHDNAPIYMKNSFTLVSSSYLNTRSVGNMNFTTPYKTKRFTIMLSKTGMLYHLA